MEHAAYRNASMEQHQKGHPHKQQINIISPSGVGNSRTESSFTTT